MQLAPISRLELERQAHDQYVSLLGGQRKPAQDLTPEVVNTDVVRGIDHPVYRVYRDRLYRVNPISLNDGIDLQAMVGRIGHYVLTGNVEQLREEYKLATMFFRKLMVPTGWRRVFRWVLPNPFRTISEREVDDLLDFFWRCRTGESFLTSVRRILNR